MTFRIALLISTLGVAGCATVDGFGEDVEAGGKAISTAANEVQDEL